MKRPLILALLLSSCATDTPAPDEPGRGDGTDGTQGASETGEPGPDPYDVQVGPYAATVSWTSYGVPHIVAEDWGSLGFGVGRAQAEHHLCAIADQVIMARSERSRFFGPDHIDGDFSLLNQGVFSGAEDGFLQLEQPLQDALVGFAAGYNQWLEQTPEADLPEACRGEPWVRPITHIDLLAYYVALGELASGLALRDEIGQAQPPGAGGMRAPVPPAERLQDAASLEAMGSNGWAIGSEHSGAEGGMLLSNTHYPWFGNRVWFEMHLTLPGEVNLYGVGLAGILFPVMGFNEDIAWTHTVAASGHFNLNLLSLDPSDPTRYLYDGEYVDMESQAFTIEVLQEDGSVRTESRTLYRSHHGVMLNAPVLGWTDGAAVSMSDANEKNLAMLPTWFAMGKATSMDELQAAHWDKRGIPWVNTIATSKEGEAWYADTTRVPGWTEAAEARFAELIEENPFIALMYGYGVVGGDGGDPVFDWNDVKPVSEAPSLERTDFVVNANDSHWLSTAEETLEGYSFFYGEERTPRSPRTRMNLRYLAETGPGTAVGEDGVWTLDELEAAALKSRSVMAEDLREGVVERCRGVDSVSYGGEEVDLRETCAALANWDGTYRLRARGAQVFREMLYDEDLSVEDLTTAGDFYAVAFDPDDALATPAGLAPPGADRDPVLRSLARATVVLGAAGIAPDELLANVQHQSKGAERFAVPGGRTRDGTISIASWSGGNDTLLDRPQRGETFSGSGLTEAGYPSNYGNSFVMAMAFEADGPQARAITTYSQSADPASEHHADQSTRLASGLGMRPILFTPEDIAADENLRVEEIALDAE